DGGTVVDAGASELVGAGRVEAPVGDARRDQHGPGAHLAAVGERDDAVRVLEPQARGAYGVEDLGPEAPGLGDGPPRQVGAGEAGGEAEVVLDGRREPRLTARRLGLDEQGRQAL